MPSLPSVPAVVRISQRLRIQGVNTANIFHLSTNAPPWSDANLTAVATGMRAAYLSAFKANLNNATEIRETVVTDLSSETGGQAIATGSDYGTLTGGVMPANCAMCVSWTINRRYRGGH